MTHDEMIQVIQAAKAGKAIQNRYIKKKDDVFSDCDSTQFNFVAFEYRVKPPGPRVIWVNEWRDGSGMVYASKEQALMFAETQHARVAVRFIEDTE